MRRAAAAAGHAVAQYNFAVMLWQGRGVDRDRVTALTWYERAAERNISEAQMVLANVYASGHDVARDLDRARHWCERASRTGNPEALKLLQALQSRQNADESAKMRTPD